MEAPDLLMLVVTTSMSHDPAPPLVAVQQCCRGTARAVEMMRLLYTRCSWAAVNQRQASVMLVSNRDAMLELAVERNRVIDRMLHQMRAVWSWMITELAPFQIRDATTTLFGAAAAWQPVELIMAATDEDGDVLMEDPDV